MLPIQFIRDNAEKVKQNVLNRRFDPTKADVDTLLQLDKQKQEMQIDLDNLRAKRNEIANKLKTERDPKLIEEGRSLKEQGAELEEELKKITEKWQEIMSWMPNMALDEVPVGKDESGNVEIKAWTPEKGYVQQLNPASGEMPTKGSNSNVDGKSRPHWEIGKELDMLDIEAGAKVSGSRFYYLKGDGVLIMNAVFDLLTRKLLKDGFTPMDVPLLVKADALYGSSHFPADQDQVYKIESSNIEDNNALYLIGSSEPSLFAYFSDSMIPEEELPKKVMAVSPCFRSEVGSWGKDVRGMKRVHQFTKLEMDIVAVPNLEKAKELHEYLLSLNEWLLQQLQIPYHVINMCTGDLGYAAGSKKYDVEVWLPSDSVWMEVGSNTITTDFQTRRLNIKCKKKDGTKEFAYTLNDTGITHRILIAIIEHYQQADGSVKVPAVLQEYIGKEVITKK